MADAEAGGGTTPSKGRLLLNFLKLYWRAIFLVLWPLVLLPVFLINNKPAFRCLYVICVMAGYWIFECLPLAATAMIPLVFFPTMGILDSGKTSQCYMKETNIMFLGGLIIAIAIEYSQLHRRIALVVISIVGCSPKRLNLGLSVCTMFVSMWISNTAATAMMLPIVQATLLELEEQNVVKMFESDVSSADPNFDLATAVPTRYTICNFLSIAYCSSIGGVGTMVGTGTNLTFKGIYETTFPKNDRGVSFTDWLIIGVPTMIIAGALNIFWLQFLYLGLLRPKSKDAKAIEVGKEGKQAAKLFIKKKLEEMGKMSFHELMVAILFVLAVTLWFFRKPEFIPGWAETITKTKVKDGCPAIFVCLLLFAIPATPTFIYAFSKDDKKRPTQKSLPLLTWKVAQAKMPWGLILLLGGGFALAEGSQNSGMSRMIGERLAALAKFPKIPVLIATCGVSVFITQIFSSNVAVANIMLPVIAEMSVQAKWHPMFLMWAVTFACSFAYCLPISTPPNAIVAEPCNMPVKQMIMAGIGTAILSWIAIIIVFPLLSPVFNLDEFPDWAQTDTNSTGKLFLFPF